MAEEPKRPDYLKPVEADKSYTPPPDAIDIDSLWLDPKLGDGLVDVHFHVIPVDKPKDFFRVHPDPDFRRRTEIYAHKTEGQIETTYYIAGPRCGGGGGSPALRSRHLHLPRRLAAAVADHVSARGRKGQHSLVERPVRGAQSQSTNG